METKQKTRPKHKSITLRWVFHKYPNYGFVIPDEREAFGWDFFINAKNQHGAEHEEIVIARVLPKSKWKKPEAKIIKIPSKEIYKPKIVEWIFVEHKDFWFLEVPWRTKWIFVHKSHKKWARNGDRVQAELHNFQDKKEARIKEILIGQEKTFEWTFVSKWDFGFVLRKTGSDIFVSESKSLGAISGDKVVVALTGAKWKKLEGIIREIIK